MSRTRCAQFFLELCCAVRVAKSLAFCAMFFRSLLIILLFAIVLSVLRFTACDYSVGIINPFLPTFISGLTEIILFLKFQQH